MRKFALALLLAAPLILAPQSTAEESMESAEAPTTGEAVFQQDPGNPCLGEDDPFCENDPTGGDGTPQIDCNTCLSYIYPDGSVEIAGCVQVDEGQTGGTSCQYNYRNGVLVSCQIAGTYCSWITVTG